MRAIGLILLIVFVTTRAPAQQTKLVWANLGDLSATGGKIQMSNPDGSDLITIVDSLFGPSGIAIDNTIVPPKIYFAERGANKIYRVNPDGSELEAIVTDIPGIYDIELDLNLRKIFWISDTYSRDAVSCANMDGLNSGIEDLYISTGTFWGYNGLALDQANRQLFWIRTDNGCEDKIFKMNYNKTNFQIIIEHPENGLLGPRDIDVYNNKIYWTDCGLSEDIIYKANFDGSGIDTVIKKVDTWFFAIDSATDKIYWENNDSIGCSNLDGSGRENILDPGHNPIYGIALAYNVVDIADTIPEDPENPATVVHVTAIHIDNVYPNPATNILTLKVSNYDKRNLWYQIYDMNGRLFQNSEVNGNETIIQMENLASSAYFLKITDKQKKEIKTFKIIKN